MESKNKKRIGCLAVIAVIIIPILYIVLGPGIKLTTPVTTGHSTTSASVSFPTLSLSGKRLS